MFQFVHIFLFRDAALCHVGEAFFPACRKLRVQKLPDRTVYHIKDHLPQKCGRDHLGFLIQRQILDVKKFLQDLRTGGTGADPASLDLGTELFILDQLSRIFHGKDHGTRIVSFGRRSLAFLDT